MLLIYYVSVVKYLLNYFGTAYSENYLHRKSLSELRSVDIGGCNSLIFAQNRFVAYKLTSVYNIMTS